MELLTQLALAVGAGALLNLTPCVLPVLPVKIRTIIRHSGAGSTERAVAASAFVAGTLLFFIIIGGVTAALHWTWGALFQSPPVLVLLIGVLAGAGALMLAGARVPVPSFASRIGGGRLFEPFSSGLLAAVLASPCTGPFLGGVLAFTLTQPPTITLSIFAAIGIGLAFPYVVILLKPDLLGFLPRGGEWSERLRQAMAFILFAGAVFFAASLLPQHVVRWLWWGWAASLFLWAALAVSRARSLGPRVIAIGFSALALSAAYGGGFIVQQASASLLWHPYSPSAISAARTTGRPVLLEFTAAWCINCKVLEETVYASPEVIDAARTANVEALQIDLTRPNKQFEDLLLHYGGAGLPFAVVLDGDGKVVRTFSGLFTAGELTRAIRDSSGSDRRTHNEA